LNTFFLSKSTSLGYVLAFEIDVLKKDITFIKSYNTVRDCEGNYRIFRRKIHGDRERK